MMEVQKLKLSKTHHQLVNSYLTIAAYYAQSCLAIVLNLHLTHLTALSRLPKSNTIIDVGDSIRFAVTATDPLGQSPIKYIWDFADTLPNSLAQNPGEVIFKNAGTYKITLTTINNNGIPDPSPATKLIVVNDSNSNQTATPIANILSPANATTVFVGDSLTFLGEGSGPGIQNPAELIYTWNFD